MLDICKPIGYLFLIIGALLIVYGLCSPQITALELVGTPARTLQINLNLPCGISMFLFACFMLGLAHHNDALAKKQAAPKDAGSDH